MDNLTKKKYIATIAKIFQFHIGQFNVRLKLIKHIYILMLDEVINRDVHIHIRIFSLIIIVSCYYLQYYLQ